MALLFFQKTIFTPLYGLNCFTQGYGRSSLSPSGIFSITNDFLTQVAGEICQERTDHGLWDNALREQHSVMWPVRC